MRCKGFNWSGGGERDVIGRKAIAHIILPHLCEEKKVGTSNVALKILGGSKVEEKGFNWSGGGVRDVCTYILLPHLCEEKLV